MISHTIQHHTKAPFPKVFSLPLTPFLPLIFSPLPLTTKSFQARASKAQAKLSIGRLFSLNLYSCDNAGHEWPFLWKESSHIYPLYMKSSKGMKKKHAKTRKIFFLVCLFALHVRKIEEDQIRWDEIEDEQKARQISLSKRLLYFDVYCSFSI